jgi:copper chaperone CopZ
MTHHIEVENIKCGGCMNTIRRALLALPGTSDVVIDKEQGIVRVEGSARREDVVTILNELGYPEKGNNAFSQKAKSFVSCFVGRLNNTGNG